MWNNTTIENCKEVYNILVKIERHAKTALPNGRTTADLINSTAEEISDFGQLVYDDEELWQRMPRSFKNRSGRRQLSRTLRKSLGRILNKNR